MTEIVIDSARVREAEQILGLQYLCYQSEAAIYDDYSIPPLTESLWELLEEYDATKILLARLGTEVVGSVRGRIEAETCRIRRASGSRGGRRSEPYKACRSRLPKRSGVRGRSWAWTLPDILSPLIAMSCVI